LSAEFLPHAICLAYDPGLIAAHAVSDAAIALAYFSIPVALIFYVWKRRSFDFRWMMILFSAFVLACGTTHAMGLLTLWEPAYLTEAVIKVITAIISVVAAIMIWPMIPVALALPEPGALAHEVAERKLAEAEVRRVNRELESRVLERTEELEQANASLTGEIQRRSAIERELLSAREEALRARDDAVRANAAKSRFLAAASHDLRQPLQAANLFFSVLEPRLAPQDENIGAQLGRCLESLGLLLGTMLDVSKLEAGTVEIDVRPFRPSLVIASVLANLGPQAQQKGLRLRHVPTDIVLVSDGLHFERVVLNFVSNAIRYTERGGVLIGVRRRADEIRLECWDTGIGIPEDKFTDIFEEFIQLGNAERGIEKGAGLGLSIVERIARLLGARVEVKSRLGRGSMFALCFPATAVPGGLP